MTNILYEAIGPNYQFKGLPYEDSFTRIHVLILSDVPTEKEIERYISQVNDTTLINPWSVQVMRGFRNYIPTTFKRATKDMSPKQSAQLFGVDDKWIPESEKILLQFQTELDAKSATIDAAIVHSRRDLGTVVNKAHTVNRLYAIGTIYGHINKRPEAEANREKNVAYFMYGNLEDETKWDNALMDMKQTFIEFLTEVPVGLRQYPIETRKPDVSKQELKTRFPYIEWLKQKLGDDLVGALLYGSAARTEDPEKYSDFDNWVIVKNVRKAEEALRATKPSVLEGKLMEGISHLNIEGSKHVGIHLFPDNPDYMKRFIRFLHDSEEFRLHTRVLYGEFPFPIVSQDEVVERGLSQAHIKLKTIAGTLNWAWNAPYKILGKPALFEFIVKNIRFFLQHSLNAVEGPAFRDKEELNRRLGEMGLAIPPYLPDLEYIKHNLVYATRAVLTLQAGFVDKRKPNLEFLVSKNIPNPEEIPKNAWDMGDEHHSS